MEASYWNLLILPLHIPLQIDWGKLGWFTIVKWPHLSSLKSSKIFDCLRLMYQLENPPD